LLRSPLKTACEKLAPLKNCVCIRFAQERALYNTDAEMMEVERGDTPFVFAGLAWCPR
jgi:hypothetical protein